MSGIMYHTPEGVIQQLMVNLALGVDPSAGAVWPIYVGNMPNAPDNCMAVRDTAGRIEGREMTMGLTFEKFGIQVRFRSKGPVDGYVKAARVLKALTQDVNRVGVTVGSEVGTATSTYEVQSCSPTSPVIKLGQIEENDARYVWTWNALVSMRWSS